jgi:hypothetical protein
MDDDCDALSNLVVVDRNMVECVMSDDVDGMDVIRC